MEHLLAAAFFSGAWKIVVFLLLLSVLVVFHEHGHFLFARINKVRVNDFAVGFGPTLAKWTSPRTGTNYRLNAFLIGGYCAMQGEDGRNTEAQQQREFRAEHSSEEDNFQAKTPWQRLSIVLAGPVANFFWAFVILFVGAMTVGVASGKFNTTIGPLTSGSPGERAGLRVGDQVLAVNGVPVKDGDALVNVIRSSPGKVLVMSIDRGGEKLDISVTPAAVKDGNKTIGRVGFSRVPTSKRLGIVEAFQEAGADVWDRTSGQFGGFYQLITKPQENFSKVTGPVGMERVAATYQDLGWAPYLSLAAGISIALGVLNLMPFPGLDGGRAAFILAELVRGRPVAPEKEALVHVAGLAVLMMFVVAVTYKDIANAVAGKGVF